MYHPTTRVLTVLEVLQARGGASGNDLATRLEVDTRTVRRYITMLQDMGIPVEARPGRHGGYRLRPGYRLPPLMFGNDEALAVTLGLLFARRHGLTTAAPAIEGALAKVERVLPDVLREQVRALAEILVLDRAEPPADAEPPPQLPATETLLALATAAAQKRRVTLTYADRHGATTTRPFDPYGVVCATNAAWYAIGHCHLRGDVRLFRLDRVARVEPDGASFVCPANFDALAHVRRALALIPAPWSAEIVLEAPLAEAQRWVAPLYAMATEENGVTILRCTATDLDWLARALAGLPFAFRVRTPPELRGALASVHARIGNAISSTG